MSYKYADLTTLQELVNKTKDLLLDYYLKTETYSKTEVNNLIAGITTITYEIVPTLPTASETTYFNDSKKVYMVRNTASTGTDFYEEYITIRSGSAGSYTYSWEFIGTTQIDLSGYVPTSRKINGKALTVDITLNASDVGAEPTITVKYSAFNRDFEDTDANIQMDGTADAGTSNKVARADHRHPSDTSKQDAITSSNKLDADLVDDSSADNTFVKVLDGATVRITDLSTGVYRLVDSVNTGADITVYFSGTTSTSFKFLVKQGTILVVSNDQNTNWLWHLQGNVGFQTGQSTVDYAIRLCWGLTYTTNGTFDYKNLSTLASTTDLPTKTSDIINDGSDGTSTYVEDDELVAITTAEVDALF